MGTELTVSGYGLVPHGYYDGFAVPTVTVWVGHTLCSDVMVVSTETIETLNCVVQDYEAGYHFVDVLTEKGYAAVSPSVVTPGPHRNISESRGENSPYPHFFLRPTITSISPETGSVTGGTMVTITGSGFSPVAERISVLLGDRNCAITSSTYSVIVCVTSVSWESGGEVMVTVNGYEADSSATYTFSSDATPTISSVVPETGVGGSGIEIIGTNFGSDLTSVSVQILNSMGEWEYDSMESLCTVSAITETSITCSLPVKPAGSYVVAVHVTGLGLADTSSTIQYDLTIDSFSPSQTGNGGGIEVTISGTGFPETSTSEIGTGADTLLSVLICSTICQVSSSSLTEVTCVLDPPAPSEAGSTCSDVRVSYSGMTSIADKSFQFRDDLTPHVTEISPLIGGTAGGTNVTIRGGNFFPPGVTELGEDDLVITIDGARCKWFGHDTVPTNSTIECRTSDHRTTLSAEVKIFVRVRGFAIPENADTQTQYQYIDRWSSEYTWAGEGLPKEGDSVVIQPGQVVFLDTDTPVLNLILVEGELVFEDLQDLHLQAKYIFINTGKLQVRSTVRLLIVVKQTRFHSKRSFTLSGVC